MAEAGPELRENAELRARIASIAVGVWLTVVVCVGAQIYALLTWESENRVILSALFGIGLASAVLISLLPAERIVRSRRREAFFLTWSALDIALIAGVMAADGGQRSPYTFLLTLPVIFAALSYPLWSTLATGLITVIGFLAVALTSGDADLEFDGFVAFALLCSALLSAWEARNAARQRTHLSRIAELLRRNERRTRLILESAHDGYVAMDSRGRIIDWNPQAERMFGWSREEVVGKMTVAETIIPPHFRDPHTRGLARYLERGEGPVLDKRIELAAIRRDGSEFPVEITITPVRAGDTPTFHAFLHDISERKRAEQAIGQSEAELRRSQARLEQAQAIAHMGSWEWDVRANRVTWSNELFRIYGLEPGEFRASFEGYLDLVHPGDRERVRATIGRALADHRPFVFQERIVRPDGDVRRLESLGEVVVGHDGAVTKLIGVCHDITERAAALEAAHEAEERFRSAFEHGPVGVALVDVDGRYIEVNRALCEIAGYDEDGLLGTRSSSITHPDDVESEDASYAQLVEGEVEGYSLEKRLIRPDGEPIWVSVSAALVRGAAGDPLYAVMQVQDVSERKRFEGQLQYLADHDPLTGLYNRRRFEQELSRQVSYNSRYGAIGAVVVVDLDHFKYVNDTLGHAVGDELIGRVGGILRDRLRDTDIVARLGGDEFAVLLPEADEAQARAVADNLLADIRAQAVVMAGDRSLRLTASAGVSLFGQAIEVGPEGVLVNADIAMYDAKDGGRDRVTLLETIEGAQTQMRARLTWSERIRHALENDRFVLFQQPILDVRQGKVTHRELLVRLEGDSGELIPPATFLYIAEQFGLIRAIDRWVVRQATAIIQQREHAGQRVCLTVNLSGTSITDLALVEFIEAEIRDRRIDASSLVFEVTETAAIVNIEKARRFAERLAELGCAFALDDFGAGFGSFYYLKHLPFDYLKIDGDFIRQLPASRPDQLTVKAIVQIAHGLGKKTVAEFVGDEQTLKMLARYGVDYAQGYHVGKPESVRDEWPEVVMQATPTE